MDLAKMTTVLQTHGGAPADYFGFDKIPGLLLPLICIPTTAGTGSEVSHSSVLTDTANHIKVSTLSPYLRPAVAIVDPLLTLSCPRQASADSGIDALTHAIEAFTSTDHHALGREVGMRMPYTGKHPLGDLLAEQAIQLIGSHLQTAVHEPNNIAARTAMSLAAMWAGMAFSNSGVALVHAMEYPVGGAVHCSHGAGNGLLLPYVMRHIMPTRSRELAQIAAFLGVETIGMTVDEAADAAIEEVVQLRRAIGIPHQLRELGVRQEQLPEFAQKAAGIERLIRLTPRPTTADDVLRIYESAW
jgi:alcohol dehydrogenase class IV